VHVTNRLHQHPVGADPSRRLPAGSGVEARPAHPQQPAQQAHRIARLVPIDEAEPAHFVVMSAGRFVGLRAAAWHLRAGCRLPTTRDGGDYCDLDPDEELPLSMGRRQSRVADDGFTLIEVMVALAILVVVATLAATTLLSVLRSTGNDRARVAAANLAAREIETVRSAFESPLQGPQSLPLGQVINAAPLPGAAAGSPLVVDNRAYTVTRTTQWQTQDASTGPCDGGSSGQLAYLRVGVKVTWADIGSTTPVTSATLLTPPLGTYNTGSGHIKAKVTDQNSAPAPGTTVTVANSSGGAVGSQLTAADGCAFFAFLAPGTYTVTASRAGYVDLNWQATPSQSITVVANQAVPAPFDNYAPAATTVFAFDGSQPSVHPSRDDRADCPQPQDRLDHGQLPEQRPHQDADHLALRRRPERVERRLH